MTSSLHAWLSQSSLPPPRHLEHYLQSWWWLSFWLFSLQALQLVYFFSTGLLAFTLTEIQKFSFLVFAISCHWFQFVCQIQLSALLVWKVVCRVQLNTWHLVPKSIFVWPICSLSAQCCGFVLQSPGLGWVSLFDSPTHHYKSVLVI